METTTATPIVVTIENTTNAPVSKVWEYYTSPATKLVVKFDAETLHPVDFQRSGWQAILDSFKNYTETN